MSNNKTAKEIVLSHYPNAGAVNVVAKDGSKYYEIRRDVKTKGGFANWIILVLGRSKSAKGAWKDAMRNL